MKTYEIVMTIKPQDETLYVLDFADTETGKAWAGPTVNAAKLRLIKREIARYNRAHKRWLVADSKATRAYKTSRYMMVNYMEFADGASLPTWMDRTALWAGRMEEAAREMDEADKALSGIVEAVYG